MASRKRYHNYHKHTHESNLRSLDCVVKAEDYIKRALELGHNTYFTTEHGYQGNVHEAKLLCEKYGIKMIVGVEAYYVENRFEKDNKNYHLIIVALNNSGYKQINKIMSIANQDGYYYKPRIDDELLFSLNPEDVIITSACAGGRLRNLIGASEWLVKMKEHFKEHFFIEVQNHNDSFQIDYNKKVLGLAEKHSINIIHANDSHYIKPSDAQYRDLFLKAKGIVYTEESNFLLDYPSSEDIVKRYREQGILSEAQIQQALHNTLIFDKAQEITCIDKEIKLPKVSENPTRELKKVINQAWLEEKKNIPKDKWGEYMEAIRYEVDIVEKTNMQEYFLLDHKVVKIGVEEYGGVITRTGRGSAPSFYINKLLGLTDIDRVDAPIRLYPSRFMSVARILESRSLPDIDLNTASPEPFIKATKDILGDDGCHWMISFKPLQDSSAFRLFCKAKELDFKEYNEIAKDLDRYKSHPFWGAVIEESKVFKGVIESVSPSPCSFLLLDKPISEEVGLMKVGDLICCNIDGLHCDKFKYLKNDLLTVSVWSIIDKVCKLAGIKIPTIKELDELLDTRAYKMYELGLTCTLNQADSDFATPLVSKYAPKSVGEVSAFVASIRPGFASLLQNFLERNPYTTNVPELDELLKDSYHYLMYQESIMAYLIWLGIEESESYDILKKIAKKVFAPAELEELQSKLKAGWVNVVGKLDGFSETWQVIEDAAKYSFNSSHSLSVGYDSLYGAYLKSHYPLEYYTVVLNEYAGDIDRTKKLIKELEYFGISFEQPKFRYSRTEYFMDKEANKIYKGIESIKYLNAQVGEALYGLRDKEYSCFTDLLIDIDGICNSRQLEILIKLGYFSEFGEGGKLLQTVELYNKLYKKKQFKKVDFNDNIIKLLRELSKVETNTMFKEVNTRSLLKVLEGQLDNESLPLAEKVKASIEYTGTIDNVIDDKYAPDIFVVMNINTKYTPKVDLIRLKDGRAITVKINKQVYEGYKIDAGDVIRVHSHTRKQRNVLVNGKWTKTDEYDTYITYSKTN